MIRSADAMSSGSGDFQDWNWERRLVRKVESFSGERYCYVSCSSVDERCVMIQEVLVGETG
jgi:hypothetical protein